MHRNTSASSDIAGGMPCTQSASSCKSNLNLESQSLSSQLDDLSSASSTDSSAVNGRDTKLQQTKTHPESLPHDSKLS